ncbi:cell cycle checkpoint [Cristinia sonorae]|uniref:Checkpoint protein n=1 Tax=Cristinia sonorae TaxID=1940300 RepID=A0A8K0XNB4_9AGAR|nr:cell cycle checkpoint [Cristinia sonorae]
MRFRANVVQPLTFARIMQTIEKLQKRCVVKFTETELHIICSHDVSDGGVQVWSQIKVDALFTDYKIQSNAGNVITMTLATEALHAALRSAAAPSVGGPLSETDITMKLAKKNDQAVLSFEILGTSRSGKHMRVAHDVRIEVMRPQDVDKLQEPLCPEPDVHILLPPLAKLRTVVDHLRAHCDTIAVHANGSGKLQISVSTEDVKTDVTWTGLTNPPMGRDPTSSQQEPPESSPEPRDPEQLYGVLMRVKSFAKFLSSSSISSTTIACICQNHAMILYVYIGEVADAGGVLTFYIPAVIDDSL